MPNRGHALDARDRMVNQRVQQVQSGREPPSKNRLMDMAKFVVNTTRRALETTRQVSRSSYNAGIEIRRRMLEAERNSGLAPSIER